jgi:hypothetical protein
VFRIVPEQCREKAIKEGDESSLESFMPRKDAVRSSQNSKSIVNEKIKEDHKVEEAKDTTKVQKIGP